MVVKSTCKCAMDWRAAFLQRANMGNRKQMKWSLLDMQMHFEVTVGLNIVIFGSINNTIPHKHAFLSWNAKQQICTMLGKRNQFGWQLPCRDLLLHDLTLSRLKVIFYLFRFIGSAVLRRCQIRCLCNVHQSLIYLIRPNSTKVVYVLQASREMSEAVLLFLLALWVLDKTFEYLIKPKALCFLRQIVLLTLSSVLQAPFGGLCGVSCEVWILRYWLQSTVQISF